MKSLLQELGVIFGKARAAKVKETDTDDIRLKQQSGWFSKVCQETADKLARMSQPATGWFLRNPWEATVNLTFAFVSGAPVSSEYWLLLSHLPNHVWVLTYSYTRKGILGNIISGFASVMHIDLTLISFDKKLIINDGIAGTGLQLTRIIFGDRFFSRNV